MTSDSFTILVADDNPENLRVLSGVLQPKGYTVRVAANGVRALAAMEAGAPDLVLLDIHMPELDGFDTFERMKASDALSDIPVIFLTALNEAFHKVKAFELGAADYICKPFEAQEVLARVSLQLRLLGMRRDLQQRNRDLEQANLRLQDHERFREVFIKMLVHDMRGPLTATFGALEVLSEEEQISEGTSQLLASAKAAAAHLALLVNSILDISRAQAGVLSPSLGHHQPEDLVERALGVVDGLAAGRRIVRAIAANLPDVCCDDELIERVLINLIDNALNHTPDDEPVTVVVDPSPSGVRFQVLDQGPGIREEERERIFELFTRIEEQPKRRPSTGLGLAFCKLALDAHGRTITVSDRDGRGAAFSFELSSAVTCAADDDSDQASSPSCSPA